MIVVGIDPGVTGAIAVLTGGTLSAVKDMPIADGRCAGYDVYDFLEDLEPEVVVVEDTQPMPKNGSIASFKLGLNTGIVLGVAQSLGYPIVRMRPVDWKRANGLIGKSKDASRYLASELWPSHRDKFKLVKHDGRAEAALIGRAYVIRRQREAIA